MDTGVEYDFIHTPPTDFKGNVSYVSSICTCRDFSSIGMSDVCYIAEQGAKIASLSFMQTNLLSHVFLRSLYYHMNTINVYVYCTSALLEPCTNLWHPIISIDEQFKELYGNTVFKSTVFNHSSHNYIK